MLTLTANKHNTPAASFQLRAAGVSNFIRPSPTVPQEGTALRARDCRNPLTSILCLLVVSSFLPDVF